MAMLECMLCMCGRGLRSPPRHQILETSLFSQDSIYRDLYFIKPDVAFGILKKEDGFSFSAGYSSGTDSQATIPWFLSDVSC